MIQSGKQLKERLEKDIFAYERKYYSRLIDVDNDGYKEVLLCNEDPDRVKYPDRRFKIILYDSQSQREVSINDAMCVEGTIIAEKLIIINLGYSEEEQFNLEVGGGEWHP